MFNPASAFPKQTTFTPYVNNGGVQRAVNAPSWGAIGPAGNAPSVSTAGRYGAVSRQAIASASGAAGVGQGINQLGARPSPANEFYQRQMAQAGKRPTARSGFASQPQPREQGIPGTPLQDRVAMMAAEVISSNKTPLAVPVAGESPSRYLPRK